MSSNKKFFYDKLVLSILSALVFITVVTVVSIVLRLGSGQGISEYYIEYRQGPSHTIRGDFGPTGSVWSMLQFVWFVLIVAVVSIALSIKSYKLKREVSIVVLSLGVLLAILALIVSNVLLGHR